MIKAIEHRHKNEKARQKAIVEITMAMIKDEHKTTIHRIISLKKEMENDIKDPKVRPTKAIILPMRRRTLLLIMQSSSHRPLSLNLH